MLLGVGCAVLAGTWVGLQLLVAGASEWIPLRLSAEMLPVYILALLGLPVAVAWLAVSRLGRRWGAKVDRTPRGIPRAVLYLLLVGYVLTTVVGVPAAQSHRDAWAVAEYKRLRASGSKRVWDAHPYIRTYVSIPLLPCVILSYHEYQLDGLYGLGTFEVAVWYGVGVRTADVWPLWIS